MVIINKNRVGIYYYANGNRYDGRWKNDKKFGRGTMYYTNGDKYEGEFKEDKRDGKGSFLRVRE
jgi:hypothetical protein